MEALLRRRLRIPPRATFFQATVVVTGTMWYMMISHPNAHRDRVFFAPSWIHACIDAQTLVPTWAFIATAATARHRSELPVAHLTDARDFDSAESRLVVRQQQSQ